MDIARPGTSRMMMLLLLLLQWWWVRLNETPAKRARERRPSTFPSRGRRWTVETDQAHHDQGFAVEQR